MRPLCRVFRRLLDIKAWLSKVVSTAMSPPTNLPANELLFQSRPAPLKTTPSNLLSLIRTQCTAAGSDLSEQSRITKIEYCKSSKAPFHEYLVFHVAYFLDGKIYNDLRYQSVVLAERFSHGTEAANTLDDTLEIAPSIDPHQSITPPPADDSPIPSFPFHAASGLPASSTLSLGLTPRASPQPRADAVRSMGDLVRTSSRVSSSSSDSPADDMISIFPGKMPPSETKKRPVSKRAVMVFGEDAVLSFEQLVAIVETVHRRVPKYRWPATQCYWFSMCVWNIICEMFPGRVEYDLADLKPMGKYKRKGLSFRTINSNGEGRFVFDKEQATKLKPRCDEAWAYWRREFAQAGGTMAAKDREIMSQQKELTSKENELTSKENELMSKEKEISAKDSQISAQDNEILRLTAKLAKAEAAIAKAS